MSKDTFREVELLECICDVRPAHQDWEYLEENFNNPEDKVSHSHQPLMLLPNQLMNKVIILLGIGISSSAAASVSIHQGWDLALATAACSVYKQQRPVLSSFNRIPFPAMISQPCSGRVTNWVASIIEGTVFCYTWNRHLIWIYLPRTQLGFYQNYSPWTSSMSHPPQWNSTQHCLASRSSFYRKKTKKFDSGSVFREFTSLTTFSINVKQLG